MSRRRKSPKKHKQSGVSRKTFKTSPAFKNSRRASGEMGAASAVSKLIRYGMNQLLTGIREKKLHNRLTSKIGNMIRAHKSDPSLNYLPWKELQGMEFNDEGSLHMFLGGAYNIVIDRATGIVTATIGEFVPGGKLHSEKEVTHFRIGLGASAINFDKKAWRITIAPVNIFRIWSR